MGGEWHKDELLKNLRYAQKEGYKTCLYSGENKICNTLKQHLTWVKTGRWNSKLGGLESLTTNQKFIE